MLYVSIAYANCMYAIANHCVYAFINCISQLRIAFLDSAFRIVYLVYDNYIYTNTNYVYMHILYVYIH